jgi:hypothetical protein
MPGYVYLICDPAKDVFKIGVTRGDSEERIHRLQTGNSTELFVHSIYKTEYPFRLEKMLHNRFKLKRELNEWFRLDTDDVVHFKDTCKLVESQIKSLLDNPFFTKDLR